MTTVRFVWVHNLVSSSDKTRVKMYPFARGYTGGGMKIETKPALLVSYVYLKEFQSVRKHYEFRDYALDSGAFSAFNKGTIIDLNEYIDTCLALIENDEQLVEVFGLDVIAASSKERNKAAEASQRNCEIMLKHGVPVIPTYHFGEPEEFLMHYAKEYPKIALGGMARIHGPKRTAWLKECFARVWPKPIHGFAVGERNNILQFPFHSTDATNWEMGPCAFGRWSTYGKMSWRGSSQNLRVEVEYYLKLEREARSRWAKEMRQFEGQYNLRLGLTGHYTGDKRIRGIQKKVHQVKTPKEKKDPHPVVRLVYFPLAMVDRALSPSKGE